VTYAEYQAGFERLVSCASKHGIEVKLMGEQNKVFDYAIPGEGQPPAEFDQCYAYEFADVDASWQLSREDTSPAAVLAEKCLRKWHLEVPAKYSDRIALMDKEGIELGPGCEKR